MLDELRLAYNVIGYDIADGKHLLPEFRRLNPNSRLPVIRDLDPMVRGAPVTVFESGAILLYLAERSGKLLSGDVRIRSLTQQWLIWQMAAFGPMSGQLGHFARHCPQLEEYSLRRYRTEVDRLLDVLEYRLAEAEFLAEEYSIAAIAVWPVLVALPFIGVDVTSRPATRRWLMFVASRDAVPEVTLSELEAVASMGDIKGIGSGSRAAWLKIFGYRTTIRREKF